jgi:2,3-bisphosphoglycerate-independent phosphoglycerate mutase
VHSHINHIKAIIDVCHEQQLKDVFIHAFTDGRDTDPKSGLGFIKELQEHLNKKVGRIATVSGRYFAMDRDKRWDRVKLAYDAMVNGIGEKATDAIEAVAQSYKLNVTDEFIKPTVIIDEGQHPLATIKNGDVALCFNFRTDRCREITQVLTQSDLQEFVMHKLSLFYTTMTEYDQSFKNVHVIFETDNLVNTMVT